MNLKNKKILVTGAAFIGAHLIKKLIKEKVSSIKVVNLTDKHKKNLNLLNKYVDFFTGDLRVKDEAEKNTKNIDIVFHLAASHGGRGYVDLYQGKTATNLLLDSAVFYACLKNSVEKVFYASSGCVYPNYLQQDQKKTIYLKEEDVKPPYDADNMYGWAKLMGEMTLRSYYKDFGLKSAIGRFFTVYGPFSSESHAITGIIAKVFIKQDPFEVWGDGNQIRNWTYVDDIVNGILLAVKKIDNAASINLGTQERIRVLEMANEIFDYTNFKPNTIKFVKKPTGPLNRVADISLAKKILGWCPQVSFPQGIKETVDWYFSNKNLKDVKKNINKLLIDG